MAGAKRQETTSLRSSSSRRDSTPPVKAAATANVGCMSGIFQLISKYHNHRKFLTFRRRQETHAPLSSSSSSPPPPPPRPETVTCTSRDQDISGGISIEKPRSPSIPADVRNSCSTSSPSVVARLMGLNDIPEAASPRASVAVERMKLLGALEKCDEDLKALKKIIDAVRVFQTPPRAVVVDGGKRVEREKEREEEEEEEETAASEEPSPVSVLDHHQHDPLMINRSPSLAGYSNRIINVQASQQQELNKHPKQQMIKKKPGQEDHNASFCLPNRRSSLSVITTLPESVVYLPTRKRPLMVDNAATTSITLCSAAMKESVSEVCRDVAQGQRREVGRMALLLQDFIYGDLVDEIIKDLDGGCYDHGFSSPLSLPFEACKRQLCF